MSVLTDKTKDQVENTVRIWTLTSIKNRSFKDMKQILNT